MWPLRLHISLLISIFNAGRVQTRVLSMLNISSSVISSFPLALQQIVLANLPTTIFFDNPAFELQSFQRTINILKLPFSFFRLVLIKNAEFLFSVQERGDVGWQP